MPLRTRSHPMCFQHGQLSILQWHDNQLFKLICKIWGFLKTFAENFHHVSIAFVGTELCQGYHIHIPNYNYTLFVRTVLKVSNSHLTNNMTINNFWVKNVPRNSMAYVNKQQICQQNNINDPSYYVKFYHLVVPFKFVVTP